MATRTFFNPGHNSQLYLVPNKNLKLSSPGFVFTNICACQHAAVSQPATLMTAGSSMVSQFLHKQSQWSHLRLLVSRSTGGGVTKQQEEGKMTDLRGALAFAVVFCLVLLNSTSVQGQNCAKTIPTRGGTRTPEPCAFPFR